MASSPLLQWAAASPPHASIRKIKRKTIYPEIIPSFPVLKSSSTLGYMGFQNKLAGQLGFFPIPIIPPPMKNCFRNHLTWIMQWTLSWGFWRRSKMAIA
jgi:hypothetical protein